MAWIESHQELREHPKTKRLCRLLALPRPMVVGYLHFLWWWAYDYAPEGDLSAFTDEDIADAVDWDGDPGALVRALIESGFLNDDRHLHDWEDFAQKWIERRQADKERKRAKRRRPEPVRETSTGRPAEIHSLSGVTGPDRTIPDLTGPIPPNPPSHGEGGDTPPAPRKRGARNPRGGRTNGVVHQEPKSPQSEGVTPATAGDREVLNQALAAIRAAHDTPAWRSNTERLDELVPIGRAADGGLHLRAPPGSGLDRFRGQVARALLDAGDQAAGQVAIVEGRPGESEV